MDLLIILYKEIEKSQKEKAYVHSYKESMYNVRHNTDT